MKQKDKFRYAEKCLYEYKRNLAGLEILREDLRVVKASDVHAQNYQFVFGFEGQPSNPEEAKLMKIESIEHKIKTLERNTKPITQMIDDLSTLENLKSSNNKILLQILKLFYFGQNIPDEIIEKMKIAKRTFFKWRSQLVKVVIGYLAL
ncbi:MAG: DUF1492 domain-containing protein [Synergistaceae bacterium]|nr:DUF1492 domain-containing protein [Synergistaceae bacterium]